MRLARLPTFGLSNPATAFWLSSANVGTVIWSPELLDTGSQSFPLQPHSGNAVYSRSVLLQPRQRSCLLLTRGYSYSGPGPIRPQGHGFRIRSLRGAMQLYLKEFSNLQDQENFPKEMRSRCIFLRRLTPPRPQGAHERNMSTMGRVVIPSPGHVMEDPSMGGLMLGSCEHVEPSQASTFSWKSKTRLLSLTSCFADSHLKMNKLWLLLGRLGLQDAPAVYYSVPNVDFVGEL